MDSRQAAREPHRTAAQIGPCDCGRSPPYVLTPKGVVLAPEEPFLAPSLETVYEVSLADPLILSA